MFKTLTNKVKQKYIDFGNFVIKKILNNNYKNICVFGTCSDDINNMGWIKSMYHLQELDDATFYAALNKNGKTLENIVDYDMVILLDLKFNNDKFDISFEMISSNDIGINSNVPVIQLHYMLNDDKFEIERDCNLFSDGISDVTFIKSQKYRKIPNELTKQELLN